MNKITKYSFVLGAIFIIYIFRYISVKAPLAGDDWAFYNLSQNNSIINYVIDFYYSWSGRIFSELWNFYMSSHKEVWNIVNPILFVIDYLCIYFVVGKKNKPIISFLFIIAMILSVFFQIRTQTYTWVTGGDHSVSLCLSLLYFLFIDIVFNTDIEKKLKIILLCLSNIILFVIGLMIENIGLAMIAGIVTIIIYAYFNNKKEYIPFLLVNLAFSIVSFCITRLSPGSAARLLRDHSDWAQLSVFEKIANGYHYFLQYGFINNSYTIAFFSIIVLGLIWFGKNNNKTAIKIISSIIMCASIFVVFSDNLLSSCSFLQDGKSIFSMLFWPMYIIISFIVLFLFLPKGVSKDKTIFFLLFGGFSATVMLMSPVNGARSYLFFVYYLILVSVLIINSYDINKYLLLVFTAGLLFIIYTKTNYYKNLYDQIEYAQEKRLVKIKYYQEHPEDEEAWIERFPENALHSIDIEVGDEYHFNAFKQYYNLPQDSDKIVFYFDK